MGYFEAYIENSFGASHDRWGSAMAKLESALANGEDVDARPIGEAAISQAADRWWTSAQHAVEYEGVDGGTSLLRIRQEARRFLLASPALNYAGLFGHAMAEASREGARSFLCVTDEVARGMERELERGNRE